MNPAKGLPDYYGVLGVPRDASTDAIRAAYRKLALLHHPDRGGDALRFNAISEAYEILSDSERRAQYDRGGQTVAFGARAAREIIRGVFHRIVRHQLHENKEGLPHE